MWMRNRKHLTRILLQEKCALTSRHPAQLSTISLPPCRLTIFDKDGTLLDDAATWSTPIENCGAQMASLVPGGSPRFFELMGYDPAARKFSHESLFMTATNLEIQECLAKEVGKTAASAYTNFLATMPLPIGVPIVPLHKLFTDFRAVGIQVAVLTSDNRRFTEDFLQAQGVSELVSTIVCGDDGLPPKPSAAPVLAICERLGVKPEATAMVGDSVARDVGCGLAANVGSAIGVTSGVSSKDEFMAMGAHVVVPTIASVLPALLARHGGRGL